MLMMMMMIYVGVYREVADELYSTSYFDRPLSLIIPTNARLKRRAGRCRERVGRVLDA